MDVVAVRDDEEKVGRKGNIRGAMLMCACFYCLAMSTLRISLNPRQPTGPLRNLLFSGELRMQQSLNSLLRLSLGSISLPSGPFGCGTASTHRVPPDRGRRSRLSTQISRKGNPI